MRVIRDERGEPLRLLALIEDISARRLAEYDQRRLTEHLTMDRDTLQRARRGGETPTSRFGDRRG